MAGVGAGLVGRGAGRGAGVGRGVSLASRMMIGGPGRRRTVIIAGPAVAGP